MITMIGKRLTLFSGLFFLTLIIAVSFAVAAARRRAVARVCSFQVTTVLLAGRRWAEEHGGRFPTNLLCMSNDFPLIRRLICPGDTRWHSATNKNGLTPAQSSYEIVYPGVSQDDTNSVFVRCRIHGYLGSTTRTLVDGY